MARVKGVFDQRMQGGRVLPIVGATLTGDHAQVSGLPGDPTPNADGKEYEQHAWPMALRPAADGFQKRRPSHDSAKYVAAASKRWSSLRARSDDPSWTCPH